MKTENKDNFILITLNDDSLDNFIKNFDVFYKKTEKKHLVLQFSNSLNVSKDFFLLLLPYSRTNQENKKSFVIIKENVDVDDFPEDFNIVPTLQEAIDVIEIEEIQRDLGF